MTTDKIDKLVRMANQIGDFYAAMPEREATEGAASHLRMYWTPKMIREIIAFADQGHPGLNAGRGARGPVVERDCDGRLELSRAHVSLAAPSKSPAALCRPAHHQRRERRRSA